MASPSGSINISISLFLPLVDDLSNLEALEALDPLKLDLLLFDERLEPSLD